MKSLLVIFIFALLSQSVLASVAAGPRVIGSGGDVYALQFVSSAEQVLQYLQKTPLRSIDLVALEQAVNSAKVESTEETLKLEGMDKDALNYPAQNRIVFSRKRWEAMATNERLALVLHEYLGLLGQKDASYQFSKNLLKDLTTAGTSEVAIQDEFSWIKIQGETAKALYDSLAVPAKNDQGEAGADLYFKVGKSYRCFTDIRANEYACDIMIANPKTGKIK
jgi:hypothetical protein